MAGRLGGFDRVGTWRDVSRMFTKLVGAPHGSRVALRHTKGTRRLKRDNMICKRKRLTSKSIPRPDDTERVGQVLKSLLVPMVDLDLKAEGLKIVAIGPDGVELESTTCMATWRAMEPKLTKEEIEQRELEEQETDERAAQIARALDDAAEGCWDPQSMMPRATLRAMLANYDRAEIIEAIQEELGVTVTERKRR